MRIAWFSPLPPSRSGIAAYSAELIPLLEARGETMEVFTRDNARDFVWKHRRTPYDLTVYQLGNASCHDYMWAYLFRYPGLVALHDAQLHQARALLLTNRWKPRRNDYVAEFRANHPDAPGDVAELVAGGLGGSLYHHWPLIRLVVERARLTVVHNQWLLEDLRERYPSARFEFFEMGVSEGPSKDRPLQAKMKERRVFTPEGENAIVIAAFGGITPEKRIPELLRALSAIADRHPRLHLMLVGAAADHYDVLDDARRCGIADRVHLTAYVPDAELGDYLMAADVCACLRWPTSRETSASWLRCLAAAKATIITDLAHLGHVPTVDPRDWSLRDIVSPARPAVAVSIDLVDEQHSLELALDRLATDAALRTALGRSARAWWEQHHRLEAMADGYQRAMSFAVRSPIGVTSLPHHLIADGSDRGRAIAARFGISDRIDDVLRS